MSLDSLGVDLFMDGAGPTPMALERTFSWEFRFGNLILDRDSVFIRYGYHGSFWERTDSTIYSYGTFTLNDSSWIQVQH